MDEKYLTKRAYAKHRGVSASYISKLAKQGRLVMNGVLVDVAATDMQLNESSGIKGGDWSSPQAKALNKEYLQVKAIDTHWSAECKRLKVMQLNGALIDANEVERNAFDQARLLRDALLSIPDRVSAEVAVIKDVTKIKEILLREFVHILDY